VRDTTFHSRRRRVLQGMLGAGALALAGRRAAAQSAAALLALPRQALIIGNSSYQDAPLRNPANDARAIAEQLKVIGFEVAVHLDAGREAMLKAIEGYGNRLAQRAAVGLFYFAGHGTQLAWRNYLIPVDAVIDSLEDVRARAVELNTLLQGLTRARNPMNVVILDACRDNPFGRRVVTEQKGLSQFDAPPGSLLAYATAPGNVASDGEGANGLYTENLLREMRVPEAKIEDVFKRVRLHVRRRTNGQQIPWESTSLEEDFYFLPPRALAARAEEEAARERQREAALREKRRAEEEAEQRKQEQALREAKRVAEEAERKRQQELAALERQRIAEEARRAQEEAARQREQQATPKGKPATDLAARQFEEQLAIWERIKGSTEPGPLEEYLLRYPSGAFSELAQFQLDRVLARLGERKIEAVSALGNPFSKGTARADTNFKVGDSYSYRELDLYTKVELRTFRQRVTRVGDNEIQFNEGRLITDLFGNAIMDGQGVRYTGAQFFIPEYSVGKKWTTRYKRIVADEAIDVVWDLKVVARESVAVPAGKFDAYRVEGHGWTTTPRTAVKVGTINMQSTYWVAPGIRRVVAREELRKHFLGSVVRSDRQELTVYTQG
jgi:uncharacterized caspase-like protein